MAEKPAVVLDLGSGFTKCGFAGANFPTAVFQSVVGRPLLRSGELSEGLNLKDIMVGDDAVAVRNALDITQPIKQSVVRDWANLEILLDYAFSEKLNINPSEHKIMLTEPPMNSRKGREKMVELLMEHYKFSHLYVGMSAVLSLYAQGLLTGLVVDTGDGVTHTVPVVEGFLLGKAVKRIDLGGRDVTDYLIKLLLRRGYAFNSTADFDTVRQIKERFCYVSCDHDLESRLAYETTVLEKSYELPDGRVLRIGMERFEAPEVLFQPHLVEKEGRGLGDLVYSTIQDCDIDVRMELYKHILLSGGNSMFPGLPTRIENTIKDVYTEKALKGDRSKLGKFKLYIEDPPRRKHMVFLGGAVLAELMKGQESSWFSREEYNEKGVAGIWEKCPPAC
eukprot:TRINITY_DN4009_c0_g1_i1.p1 TRINITY_DN4009_c0_g1~~TRINITY_DN4009_c0_g1_i1.p1  ORF type:complete len:392 (+),score=68.24 TRINITY_DN4009_c0_g1_i1:171-1346(+)